MELIKIKPLSVNQCWQGQRFKTGKYIAYERELLLSLLPKMIFIPEGKLQIYFEFGLSNKGFDYDNAIKPIQDILQKKYGFDDNRIYMAFIKKKIVKKGEEYIKFKITSYESEN